MGIIPTNPRRINLDTNIDPKYNTRDRRFFALILDIFLVYCLGIMVYNTIIIPVLGELGIVFLKPSVFIAISFFIYRILMHWKLGQTVGKIALDIRLFTYDKLNEISLKQSIVREITPIVMGMSLVLSLIFLEPAKIDRSITSVIFRVSPFVILLINMLTIITNKYHRVLHDYISKTVITTENSVGKTKKLHKANYIGIIITSFIIIGGAGHSVPIPWIVVEFMTDFGTDITSNNKVAWIFLVSAIGRLGFMIFGLFDLTESKNFLLLIGSILLLNFRLGGVFSLFLKGDNDSIPMLCFYLPFLVFSITSIINAIKIRNSTKPQQ